MKIQNSGVILSKADSSISAYMHRYEAYRVPKGTKVMNASGEEMVLSGEEDVLVLTEKAGKQLLKDRQEYGARLFMEAELANQKTQAEASSKYTEDIAKVMTVYRAMSKGDIVPPQDEKRLRDYNSDLYQAAKLAQAMAQMEERKKHKSQWDEREEAQHQAKMEKLRAESEKAMGNIATGQTEFQKAQKANIVEIDATGVDFSGMKTVNLGAGVVGANFDLEA